jgi:hypothetical protein
MQLCIRYVVHHPEPGETWGIRIRRHNWALLYDNTRKVLPTKKHVRNKGKTDEPYGLTPNPLSELPATSTLTKI